MGLLAIIYFIGLVAAVVFFLMHLARIAAAQEERSRHLLEIARDLKAIAIATSEKSKPTDKSGS